MLREWASFGPKRRWQRGNQFNSFPTEWEGIEKIGLTLLESAQWMDQSKLTQTRTWEILTHCKKKTFSS